MAEDIKEILKGHSEDVKRHMDILKEDFDSKIDLVIERQDSHEKRFDSIDAKLDSHTEMIGEIQVNIEIVKNET